MPSDGAVRAREASTRCTYDRLFQMLGGPESRGLFQGSRAGTDHFMIGLGILFSVLSLIFFIFLRRCSLERGGAVRCLDNFEAENGRYTKITRSKESVRRN